MVSRPNVEGNAKTAERLMGMPPDDSNRTVPDLPVYRCWTNQGIDDLLHHHHVSIPTHKADDDAWAFAVPYIRNPDLIRDHVLALKKQVVQRDHSQDLAGDIAKINKSVAN